MTPSQARVSEARQKRIIDNISFRIFAPKQLNILIERVEGGEYNDNNHLIMLIVAVVMNIGRVDTLVDDGDHASPPAIALNHVQQ